MTTMRMLLSSPSVRKILYKSKCRLEPKNCVLEALRDIVNSNEDPIFIDSYLDTSVNRFFSQRIAAKEEDSIEFMGAVIAEMKKCVKANHDVCEQSDLESLGLKLTFSDIYQAGANEEVNNLLQLYI